MMNVVLLFLVMSSRLQKTELYTMAYCLKYNVDYKLVKSVMETESNIKHGKISKEGAIGIMQIMPNTAKELKIDPYNERENIEGGIKYLSIQLKKFSKPEEAIAAYNAGPKKVLKYHGVPPYKQTKKYVKQICQLYQKCSG